MSVVTVTGWWGGRRVFYWDDQSFLLDEGRNELLSLHLLNRQHSSFATQLNPAMNIMNNKRILTASWLVISKARLLTESQTRLTGSMQLQLYSATWRVSRQQLVDSQWNWVCGLWCLSYQRGVGIFSTGTRQRCSTGNITRLLNWIFLFMIPASPLRIHRAAVQETSTVSQGKQQKKGGIHYTLQASGNTQLLCAYCIIQWCKTWGGLWGHYTKITEKTLRPEWGRQGRLKKNLTDLQIARSHTAVSNQEAKNREGKQKWNPWHM